MSGKRIVVEEPNNTCLHGHVFGKCASFIDPDFGIRCPGGSRRTLTEGQYVLIEKVDGRWPTWAMQAMGEAEAEAIRQARWSVYFDALSDHTEGTP